MKFKLTFYLAAAFAFCAYAPAHAQHCITQKIHKQQEQYYLDSAGNPASRLVEAVSVNRGDELVYTVLITSTCAAALPNVAIDIPVPDHVTYTKTSAKGDGTDRLFSADGINYARWDFLKIKQADGSTRPAEPTDIKSIRWVFKQPVPAGTKQLFHFHAVAN